MRSRDKSVQVHNFHDNDGRDTADYPNSRNDFIHVCIPFLVHGPQQRMVAAIEPIMSSFMTATMKFLNPMLVQNGS